MANAPKHDNTNPFFHAPLPVLNPVARLSLMDQVGCRSDSTCGVEACRCTSDGMHQKPMRLPARGAFWCRS